LKIDDQLRRRVVRDRQIERIATPKRRNNLLSLIGKIYRASSQTIESMKARNWLPACINHRVKIP
jgi:hypothetical protein